MADNEELKRALAGPTELWNYDPRQRTESWQEYLRRSAPLGFAGLMTALSAVPAFRGGQIVRGPYQGTTMPDFAKAAEIEAALRARQQASVGRQDLGITGGPTVESVGGRFPERMYTTEALREYAKNYTPQPIRSPEVPQDPYDAAVAIQAMRRGAANK